MKHVVDVKRKVLDEDDRHRLAGEHNLARYSWDLGFRDNAYDLMNYVVSVQERVLAESHPDR